ncbi:MAG: hypothetical protein ACKPCM_15965, partial [Pseudanabaena sp.]
LAPGRVAQSFAVIIAVIGTPAIPPKLRGKSPGRSNGDQLPPRIRYPTVKKHESPEKTRKRPHPHDPCAAAPEHPHTSTSPYPHHP